MGKSSTKAKNKYNEANYDRIHISVPKGDKEKYKALASSRGLSLTQLIVNLLEKESGK